VTSLPGTSILPPDMPGREDYTVLDTKPGRTDPGKAKALLKRAGFAPGEYRLSWPYDASDAFAVEGTDQMVKAFERAGFKAIPHPTPDRDAYEALDADPNAPINMRQEVGGWCADWPAADSFLPPLFKSDAEANNAYFSEPSVDKEIDRISGLPLDQQPDAWGALDKMIMSRYYPVIVTDYGGVAMPHGSRIGGMRDDSTAANSLTWKDLYVIR
jgi:peptide/nickel transport system substrate-binding protein